MSRRPRRVASTLSFSSREIRDLVVAWIALSIAFGIFFLGGGPTVARLLDGGAVGRLGQTLVASALTAGTGFLLHELAHKVVAVRFGQRAAFRADYGMLGLAVAAAAAGFLFAAPGAVHHEGRITKREHGLVAVAGPVVNVGLAALFLPVWLAGGALDAPTLALVGRWGLIVNCVLAAFNMIPFGPLDGATVRAWSTPVWLAVFLPTTAASVWLLLTVGLL